MNSTTKKADWSDYMAGGVALGGGTFAIGALLQEVMRQQEQHAQRVKASKGQQFPENALVLDLPKQAEEELFLKEAWDSLNNALAFGAGGGGGFLASKALYDHVKKKQTDAEIAKANQKYLQALQSAGQKVGEETPLVDAFCESAATELDKLAGWGATLMDFAKKVPGMIGRNPQYLVAPAGAAAMMHDFSPYSAPSPNIVDKTTGAVGDAWKALALLTAAGTTGTMMHAANKAEERSQPRNPDSVALNYQNTSDPTRPSL